jgi:hypothetical protein
LREVFPEDISGRGAHLEVSDRTVEGIVAQSALLVQKLPGLAVLRRAKQSIIEAFFQFLGQRGQTLLLDVPHELVPRKLEALLHVEFRNVDPDQKVALVGASFALLLHPGLDVHIYVYLRNPRRTY